MIGLTVGRHRVLSRLGPETTPTPQPEPQQSLWRAQDTLLRRDVALQIVSGARAIPLKARRRFLREAEAATRVDHPGIAAVLDFGQDGDLLYTASALVAGETLEDRIRRKPLSPEEAVRIAHEVVRALGAAHANGTVHGGVSPEHILLVGGSPIHTEDASRQDPIDRPILTGFCLALLQTDLAARKPGVAPHGAGVIAPEIVLGSFAEQRSDLYGLGAVLHFMLTGNLPGDEEAAASSNAPLTGESERSSPLQGVIPADLDSIVRRALARNPQNRYQNAEEMAADLEALLPPDPGQLAPNTGGPGPVGERDLSRRRSDVDWINEPPIPLARLGDDHPARSRQRGADHEGSDQASDSGLSESLPQSEGQDSIGAAGDDRLASGAGTPPAIGHRTGSRGPLLPRPVPPSRRKMVIIGGGAVLLVSIACVIGLGFRASRAPAIPHGSYASVAVLPMQTLGVDIDQDRYLANGMSRHLADDLSLLRRLRVTPWATSSRFSGRRHSTQDIGQRLNVDAMVTSTLRRRGGRIEIVVGLVDTKTDSSIWSTRLEEPSSGLFTLQRRAALELAARLLGPLAPDEEADLGKPPAASLEAYENYLQGAFAIGKEQGAGSDGVALEYFDKAVTLDPNLAAAHVEIGVFHLARALRDASERRKHLKEAEKALRSTLEKDPTNLAALRGMVRVFWLSGEPLECLKFGHRVPRGWATIDSLTARAEAYLYGGLCDQASELLRRAIELDPLNQDAHFSLVRALAWSGRYQQAVEAGAAYLREFGDDPDIRLTIGQALWSLGQLNRAHEEYSASAGQALDNPVRQWFADVGRLERALGDPVQAQKTWEAGAVALKRHLLKHRRSAEAHFALAEISALQGNVDLFNEERTKGMEAQGSRPEEPNEVIAGYVALGEKDRALDGLRRRLAAGHLGQFWFNVERLRERELQNMPGFNPLLLDYKKLQNRLKREF